MVCTLTGNGLKDPDTVFRVAKEPKRTQATVKAVEDALNSVLEF